MVCVGLSERDLLQWHDVTRKILGRSLGGPGKIWGAKWPRWHPPSSAPALTAYMKLRNYPWHLANLKTLSNDQPNRVSRLITDLHFG